MGPYAFSHAEVVVISLMPRIMARHHGNMFAAGGVGGWTNLGRATIYWSVEVSTVPWCVLTCLCKCKISRMLARQPISVAAMPVVSAFSWLILEHYVVMMIIVLLSSSMHEPSRDLRIGRVTRNSIWVG